MLDKLWATLLGRQPVLFEETYETSLPEISVEVDQLPWRAAPADDSCAPVPSFQSTTLHHSGRLMNILERILRSLYSFKTRLYSSTTMAQVSAFQQVAIWSNSHRRDPALTSLITLVSVELERFYASLPTSISISPYTHKIPPNHIITLH